MFWWHGYAWRARENKQFKCRVCDKDFAQKKPMKRHVFTVNNLHPDSKMFSCHNYAGIINQLCRKDWRRNTIRKSTRPRVLNAIIATNFFFFFQKGPYQIANLWEVIGCSLGSFIHPSIRDRPRGWSNFLVDFLFLASCSVLSQSELLDVLYLADPNSVFSRWKKGLGESPRSATLGCLSGSFF